MATPAATVPSIMARRVGMAFLLPRSRRRWQRQTVSGQVEIAALAHGDHVGDAHAVEDFGHGVAHLGHQQAHAAALHVPAVAARPIGGAARTGERRERPVDRADDVTDLDGARFARESVAAAGSLAAVDDAGAAKLAENGVEKLFW